MSITLKEIKDAVCGRDINSKSKALSVVGVHKYNMANTAEEPKVIAEFSSVEPIVSVTIGKEITWISLEFIREKSSMLSLFFRAFERYLEETDNNSEESEAVAFLTLLPIEYSGQYYITAMHPIMWALEPKAVGEDSRILRIAYFTENISFIESDFDEDFFEKVQQTADVIEAEDKEVLTPKDERNAEFTSDEKYIADLTEDETDDDKDEKESDAEETPTDRASYVYH